MRLIIFVTLLIVTIGICPAAATAQDTSTPQTLSANDLRKLTENAERGDVNAQYNLGVMYYKGLGVPQDYAESIKWYRRAAEQGDVQSQGTLGAMYGAGQGVPQNFEEAYAWLSLAGAQGNKGAQHLRENTAKELTRTDLLAAQQLSKRYFADYVKKPSDAAP